MRINKEFVLREIAGDYIIIPIGATALEFNGLITVNEVGVTIWNMLQEEVTMDDLVREILSEYDVEEAVVRADVEAFLGKLVENNIITEEAKTNDITKI